MYIKDKDGNYVPTPSSKGADGREVSLRVANNYIQWRYPDTEWTNLVPLSSLKGEPGTDGIDGREVHMRVVSDTLQWRLGDSGTWQTLMSLSTVTDGAAFGGMVVDKTLVLAEMEAGGGGVGSAAAVTYTPQTLTEEQKSQARTNIGAEKAGTAYTKPASGIPKSDLASDVQTSLAKADTAISLGLTAATPGQIIKVKTVQDGKPTEWEAVDMPGGEEWEKIADIELRADTALYVLADFAVWRKAKVIMRRSKYVAGLDKNVWCRVAKKSDAAVAPYSCGYLGPEYGYVYWDFSAEVSNSVISSTTLRNNNPNALSQVMSTQTLTPLNFPPTDYVFTLTFTDTSVIQDGDKVTVIGVRR